MKNSIALIALLSLAACHGCGSKPNACDSYTFSDHANMLVLGDSHSWGLCESPNSFVYALSQSKQLNLRNYAISGSRAITHLSQLHLYRLKPSDTVVYLAGYNDMDSTGWTSDYESTFGQILDELNASGAKVYIGGILPYTNNKPNAASFNAQLKAMVLARQNLHFVPVFETFQPLPQYYRPNNDIHLNVQGNAVLLEIFKQYMQ